MAELEVEQMESAKEREPVVVVRGGSRVVEVRGRSRGVMGGS